MAIEERTVCDSGGKISSAQGTLCPVDGNPYLFWAGIPNGDIIQDGSIMQVQMVLPVGGDVSGLYRFPRAGERVLVEVAEGSGGTNYLLGYVPQDTAAAVPFTSGAPAAGNEKEKLTGSGQGLIFRYKNTAAKEGDPAYSEIGFYRQAAEEKRIEDALSIFSAGYTSQKAVKSHSLHANGIEMLSGLFPGAKLKESDDLAVGHAVGETYALGESDVQIRAGGQVVIKAAKRIILQVGRSQISIDDTGINLISEKMNTDWPNTYNTILKLTARKGISMFGQSVNITGGRNASMADSYGGGVNFSTGMSSMSGREVAINTYDQASYLALVGMNAVDIALNVTTAANAIQKKDPNGENMTRVKLAIIISKKIAKVIADIVKGAVKIHKAWGREDVTREAAREGQAAEESLRQQAQTDTQPAAVAGDAGGNP